MKNILITGGAGFIGSETALVLLKQGFNVTVLDCLSPQIHGEDFENSPLFQKIRGKVNFIKGDVTNYNDVQKALENQEAVIHLAAETGTGQSMYEVAKYSHVNVTGTAVLLQAVINNTSKIKKFILASSRAVYGEGKYVSGTEEVYPNCRKEQAMKAGNFAMYHGKDVECQPAATDENAPLRPVSLYGLTKLQQEQLVAQICDAHGINYTIFRFQNVYGPGQSLKNPYTGILSIFSTQILNGNEINIFEDGKSLRDFVYVDDVITAMLQGLTNSAAHKGIFNVGSGQPVTVLDMAEKLISRYTKNVKLNISGDFRVGDIRHNFADLTHAENVLGFKPSVSLDEGLAKFTNWVLTQNIEESNYLKSLAELKQKGFLK